jgi:TPR repeat protein
MRHLLHFLFATGVALSVAVVPARANFADAQAAFELGDYQTAYAEFLRLAQTGDSNAETALGVLYDDGHGVPKDQRVAVMWYRKAAEKGNPQAQLNLGIHCEQGEGVEQDYAVALGWYRKAAEQGYAAAEVALGNMYYRGRGVAQNKKEANAWFQQAAEQGNASAQQNLANALYFGDGAEINYGEAFKLYQRAAAQGYGDSQYNLGVMYEKGQGVPKDVAQAYFWWLLASAREVPDAARNRDRIEKSLTPAQRAEAQTAAGHWKPTLAQANRSKLEANSDRAVSRGQKSAPDVTGTAFRISPTYYVTNLHVVHGCQRLRVNGSQSAERQASDERNDLALLSVPASGGATAIMRIGRINLGEQVTAVGFPLPGVLSSPLNVTSGKVNSLSGLQGDTRFVQISAPTQLASSGAVFDASGNVLGVVEGKPNAAGLPQATGDIPQNANFVITSNALQGFLDANSVDFDTAGLGVSMPSAQVAASAKDVVALVECWQ